MSAQVKGKVGYVKDERQEKSEDLLIICPECGGPTFSARPEDDLPPYARTCDYCSSSYLWIPRYIYENNAEVWIGKSRCKTCGSMARLYSVRPHRGGIIFRCPTGHEGSARNGNVLDVDDVGRMKGTHPTPKYGAEPQ